MPRYAAITYRRMNQKIELQNYRKQITGKLALLDRAEAELADTLSEKCAVGQSLSAFGEATQLLRDLYEQTQERFHGQIMQIVSYCLAEVFGNDAYEFKILFNQKRGQCEAQCAWYRDGEYYTYRDIGGGVLDVSAMALRLAVIYLSRRSLRSVVIMDEMFKYLSVEYRSKMSHLLERLCDEFGFQFILVTHASEFELGKVYRIGRSD